MNGLSAQQALQFDLPDRVLVARRENTSLDVLCSQLQDHHSATWRHSRRVARIGAALAAVAGFQPSFCEELEAAALLHDVGKLGILATLLDKEETLSASDHAIFRRHALYGHTVLRSLVGPGMAADIALCHHERWDGFGYPHRLRANAIPIAARLTAIADVYDALRAPRAYKTAATHNDVVAAMQASGGHFDPELLAVFVHHEAIFAELFDAEEPEPHSA